MRFVMMLVLGAIFSSLGGLLGLGGDFAIIRKLLHDFLVKADGLWQVALSFLDKRRSRMPVLCCIHSSEVSINCARSAFVTTRLGR
jgi:hypothetical protein